MTTHLTSTLDGMHACATETAHQAFTSLCRWRGRYYLAYRHAMTHDIVPPGRVDILVSWEDEGPHADPHMPPHFSWETDLTHPRGDVRDPRFMSTQDALYCMVGVYLPAPGETHLSRDPAENTLVTHLTYTIDGNTWAPLMPILRPNYWGWSAMQGQQCWYLASYHTGRHQETSSIMLWTGQHLWQCTPFTTIYDGANLQRDGRTVGAQWHSPHYLPSEPVLWSPVPGTLACCVRSEGSMDIGVSYRDMQNWRWRTVQEQQVHPSAVMQTAWGTILVGRLVTYNHMTASSNDQTPPRYATALFRLTPQYTLDHLLTLPSGGDCGYAGLAPGPTPDTLLISWYSQHAHLHAGPFGVTLPHATVFVAQVHLQTEG